MQKLNDVLQEIAKEYSFSLNSLQNAYHRLSQNYQQSSNAPVTSLLDALAYAMARMPATLSVMKRVLSELPSNYVPSSILDLGCGPGSSLLAIDDVWRDNRPSVICIDENSYMLELAQRISSKMLFVSTQFERAKLTKSFNCSADIVLMSYVLGEISRGDVERNLVRSWEMANDFVIIILPGTPQDSKLLLKARELLISMGGTVLAPCPHSQKCPLQDHLTDWCHFSERLERSKTHRSIKLGTQAFEDEKFCYVIISKKPYNLDSTHNRIIKKPIICEGHVIHDLCTHEGIQRQTFSRKDQQFKRIKKLKWGDVH